MKFLKRNKVVKRKRGVRDPRTRLLQSLRVGAGIGALLLLPSILWYGLLNAPCLAITDIQVEGCNRLAKSEVVQCAGIREGQNILSFSIGEATKRLESNPWVYRALVKRILPSTVSVCVQERQARARIQLDRVYLVDSNGEIFAAEGAREERLPLLYGISEDDISTPDTATFRLLQSALNLIASLHAGRYQAEADVSIAMDKIFGLTMHDSGSGTSVLLGFDDFDRKLALLRMVQDDLAKKGMKAASINLSTLKQAFVAVQDGGHVPAAVPLKKAHS